ncbi:cytochrome c biogenesis CcdA family protein [Paenibacillus sp. Marseille-Q7038]
MTSSVTIWLAFSGGILAFISPCTLPLYPSFISFITGLSGKDIQENKSLNLSKVILINSTLFVLGFSIIYYVLGYSASLIGNFFYDYNDLIRMLGAIFIGIVGMFLIGIFQPKVLMKEFRIPFIKTKNSSLTAFLVGIIFAAGWTPCIGPIFATIMYASVLYPGQTFINITAYTLGFGLPFIFMGFFVGKTKWVLKYSSILMKIGGALLILIAILLYTDKFIYLNIWFQKVTNGGWG